MCRTRHVKSLCAFGSEDEKKLLLDFSRGVEIDKDLVACLK